MAVVQAVERFYTVFSAFGYSMGTMEGCMASVYGAFQGPLCVKTVLRIKKLSSI